MRHFVRFAKLSASGSVDRVGWRLRIFLTSREAGASPMNLPAICGGSRWANMRMARSALQPTRRAAFGPTRCAPTSAPDAVDRSGVCKPIEKVRSSERCDFETTTPCPPVS